MPNAEKIAKVAALKERIHDAEALLLTEYRGLSVHDATELRRALSEQARFKKSSRPASASSKAPTRRFRSRSGHSTNTASD